MKEKKKDTNDKASQSGENNFNELIDKGII